MAETATETIYQPLIESASPEELEALFALQAHETPQSSDPAEALYPDNYSDTYLSPLVTVIPETQEDQHTQQEAAHFIGQVLTGRAVEFSGKESPLTTKPIESLHGAIQLGAEGDESGINIVKVNVGSESVETTIKSKHITEIDLMAAEAREIQQHGQTMKSVQANSLRYAAEERQILERTKIEATNTYRLQKAFDNGELEDETFVELSLAADNMTKEEMEGKFFTDTMTWMIRATTIKNGRLVTEVAMMSGLKEPGSDIGERHDMRTIGKLGKRLKIDFTGKTVAQILDTPFKIKNAAIPNGAIDLVEMCDECAHEDGDGNILFGEERPKNEPRQDYLEVREQCRQREATYEPQKIKITNELLAKAKTIHTPLEAVKQLHDVTEKHMVERAITDYQINPMVFGEVSAPHIERARYYDQQGNQGRVEVMLIHAIATAASFSCPTSFANSKAASIEAGEDQFGSLKFACPGCGHTNTREPNMFISNCKSCGIDVTC